MSTKRTALITGYTGETGRKLLDQLLRKDEIEKIILVGRRIVEYTDQLYKEKTEQRQINFDEIDDFAAAFHGADVHFCCLGTTRDKAGPDGVRRVDFDYIVGAARLAKQEGCKHFHLLSSQGADAHSLFLYYKVKGQTENALCQMSFERLSIYRPTMIIVDRKEHRPLERFTQTLARYTVQRLSPQWITVPVEILASAICENTFTKDRPSIEILDNRAIFRLVESQCLRTDIATIALV